MIGTETFWLLLGVAALLLALAFGFAIIMAAIAVVEEEKSGENPRAFARPETAACPECSGEMENPSAPMCLDCESEALCEECGMPPEDPTRDLCQWCEELDGGGDGG